MTLPIGFRDMIPEKKITQTKTCLVTKISVPVPLYRQAKVALKYFFVNSTNVYNIHGYT